MDPATLDHGGVALRLAIDLVAIAVLAFGFSYRRHRRRDLVVLYVIFNVGLFAAVVAIQTGDVEAAVGFGLFAVLSIIRLRAETLTNPEIAYFFASIVLGLVAAIDLGDLGSTVLLSAVVLAAPGIVDHPAVLRGHLRLDVTLDQAVAGPDAAKALVEERLGARVIGLEIAELDYVRDITRVEVRLKR